MKNKEIIITSSLLKNAKSYSSKLGEHGIPPEEVEKKHFEWEIQKQVIINL
jgi:hypothetical protein